MSSAEDLLSVLYLSCVRPSDGDKALPSSDWSVELSSAPPAPSAAAAVDTNIRVALMNCQLLLTASHLSGFLCSCEDQSHDSPLKILPVEASR
ncbi:hypothetical protein QQF64_031170 [Cirrhinus molitorella]|uniref:Uncharacterized protein n=1 Tax=Cirrhinus molitorella TaxID=172907 RepID=A0ABR3N5J1_9TELE